MKLILAWQHRVVVHLGYRVESACPYRINYLVTTFHVQPYQQLQALNSTTREPRYGNEKREGQ